MRFQLLANQTTRGTLLAGLAALALAGCAQREPTITGSLPHDGYKTRHPILLSEQAETIDLPVGSQATKLSDRATGTITAFAAEAVESGAQMVTVLMPKGSANEIATRRLSRPIGAALAQGGIRAGAVSYRFYPVDDPGVDAPVRLAYAKIKAGLDHACGQWPEQIATTHQNVDYWDFGCSTQANLAAMVVEPTDLVTPRGATAASATRRQTIFKAYEAGEATTSSQKLENKGTINNLSGG
jgi:pilus assembly protein CpaD